MVRGAKVKVEVMAAAVVNGMVAAEVVVEAMVIMKKRVKTIGAMEDAVKEEEAGQIGKMYNAIIAVSMVILQVIVGTRKRWRRM